MDDLAPPANVNKGFRSGLDILFWLLRTAAVEPFVILYFFSFAMRSVTTQEVIQLKVCRYHFDYNETVCDSLNDDYKGTAQTEVQRITTNITMGTMMLIIIPNVIVVIFLGSFSDKYGRKRPIMIACLGNLLEIIGTFFCVFYMKSSALLLLLPTIPSALTGGIIATMTMSMSHLGETTEPENRALRFAFIELGYILGMPAGGAFGGLIRKKFGFQSVYIVSFVVLLLSFIWIAFRLQEPNKQKITNCHQGLKDLFSIKNIRENIHTSTKRRQGNVRKQIWILYMAICCNVLNIMGTVNIGFMYVQVRYNWDNFTYSMVNSITSVVQGLALAVLVPVMTKVFSTHDSVIVIVGSASTGASMVVKAFASETWLYYISCVLGLATGLTSIGVRSRLSKLVDVQEIGKIFSVMALCESMTPIIGAAVWTQLYNASVDFFPGLTYLCTSLIAIIPIIAALWIFLSCPNPPTLDGTEDLVNPTAESSVQENYED